MGGYESFYGGAGYSQTPDYGGEFQGFSYRVPTSQFGMATDPRTANQLKAVSDKFNTGGKVVEVTGITPDVVESIPNQHLEELNRLRKLTGSTLTFHGPLVEATGFSRDGWDEGKRQQAERQMLSAVERGRKLDPKGNVVITFHSANGLPEMIQRQKIEGQGKEAKVTEVYVIDQQSGNIGPIKVKPNYLLKDESPKPDELIKQLNEENWERRLAQTNHRAHNGTIQLESIKDQLAKVNIPEELKSDKIFEQYGKQGTPEGEKFMQALDPKTRKVAEELFKGINHGDIYIREAYNDLQTLFNDAYANAKKYDITASLEKLNKFRDEIAPKIKQERIKDPRHIEELGTEVVNGLKLLSSIEVPKMLSSLQEFALDKASDTFSNVAFKSFKQFGDTAPIISIENPPAGGGLSRGEDLRQLVEKTRDKFVQQATKAKDEGGAGLTKNEAKEQAAKLIGVTWDVGHINMIRKFGYSKEDVVKETEQVAKLIKHVHLSDNFGLEHTELPMGMGNVPMKEHLALIQQYNKKAKQIIETGHWYQHFQRTPLPETLAAFGSPIYGMTAAPYWNQAHGRISGGYFAGYGMNPDVHHSLYGAGFSNLPVELGGQMAGRSRLSGAPTE